MTKEQSSIQTSAAIDFIHTRQWQRANQHKNIIWGIISLGLILWSIISFRSYVAPNQKPLFSMSKPPTQVVPETVQRQIQEAVRKTQGSVFDINDDGLVNCIDYAIIFCMFMPKSQIIHNENKSTGMNHLFNSVTTPDGTIIYIEPQTGKTMQQQWGFKYNERYNVNETRYYAIVMLAMEIFSDPKLSKEDQDAIKALTDILKARVYGD